MALEFIEQYQKSRAPGKAYCILQDGQAVGHLLWTGLDGATWNLYTRGVAVVDGVQHDVWRILPGQCHPSYEAAVAAAQQVWTA